MTACTLAGYFSGRSTQEDPIGLAGGLNLYGYGDGDPLNNSDPFGLCPQCFAGAVAVVLDAAGPAFDALNPDGYVVSNPLVRINTVALYRSLADQRNNPGFEFQVTGGDRYQSTTTFVDGEGNASAALREVRSSSNNALIPQSSPTSNHLESRGATAIDLRIKGVDVATVDAAIKKTGFDPKRTRRDYPDAPHTHVEVKK